MSDAGMASTAAAALAAIAVAAAAYAVVYPYLGDRKQDVRRRGVVDGRRETLTALEQTAATRRKSVSDTLKEMEERQKKAERISLRLRLQRAGFNVTTRTFWLASAATGLGLAGLTTLLLSPGLTRSVLVVVIGIIGFVGVPRWFLNKATARRQYKFISELPNAIDIVVRGMKSGLPLNECLAIIARESEEPLASEFREVIEQQRVGVSLGEALDRLAQRMPLPEVKFLTIVVAIQQQAGGNLSEALGNLSQVLRDRFRLRLKVKALSAEAKASAAVLASLPPIVTFMLYLLATDYIAVLFTTRTGNFALLACGIWMLMGVLMMRRMINFKF
ncbi:type II secretion system F family protein [Hyphomicrobium sp. D-2]|uniref:type II secretion system F family protein n=1 Tax=Hyphomicrobium sp. D-2 TaxID=3041621 RepID=UPI002453E5F4|nr:type II secretion system F family protein [Hyphomicrobium sp. D-2]MDH4980976.1 type II secretion system F family protein [Hyphomicrobium sp. D-2]